MKGGEVTHAGWHRWRGTISVVARGVVAVDSPSPGEKSRAGYSAFCVPRETLNVCARHAYILVGVRRRSVQLPFDVGRPFISFQLPRLKAPTDGNAESDFRDIIPADIQECVVMNIINRDKLFIELNAIRRGINIELKFSP